MENRLTIKICTGTLCYLMGGADLQLLDEHLSEDLLAQVDIKGSPCLDCCNSAEGLKAPFVMVGDTLIDEASVSKVVEVIKQKLSDK